MFFYQHGYMESRSAKSARMVQAYKYQSELFLGSQLLTTKECFDIARKDNRKASFIKKNDPRYLNLQ